MVALRTAVQRRGHFEIWLGVAAGLHIIGALGAAASARLSEHDLGRGLSQAPLDLFETSLDPAAEPSVSTEAQPPPVTEAPAAAQPPPPKVAKPRVPEPALPAEPAPLPEPLERRVQRAFVAAADAVAAAARALTRDDDAAESMSIASGDSDRPTSGEVAGDGRGATRTGNPRAAIGGTPGGRGKATGPDAGRGPDRSRRAVVVGGMTDACAFPTQADVAGVDHAVAVVMVRVRSDGKPEAARVLRDPGHGFGEAARRCALQATYVPARERDGKPIAMETGPINVRFTR